MAQMPTPSKPSLKRYVYVIGDDILTSPCPFPPRVAVHGLSPDDPDPSVTHLTCHSDNRYPAMAWVPTKPAFDSKPLHVLQKTKREFGVHQLRDKYVLDWQLCKEWNNLEINLIYVASALACRTSLLMPLDSEVFPFPSRYGYRRLHKSHRGAEISAEKSLHAFGPLMGWISLLISHNLRPSQTGPPLWEVILARAGVSGDYITLLRESELLKFDVGYPRAGVIITRDCQFKNSAAHMVKHFVPYWVLWTNGIQLKDMGPLACLAPTPDEISKAYEAAQASKITPNEFAMPNDESEVAMPEAVMPDASKSGAKPWHSFFEQRRKLRPGHLARETLERKIARLQREKAAEKHLPPGGHSTATFFRWTDADTPQRVRKQMTRNEAEQMWSLYSDRQRRYDSLTNEWDICTEFGDGPSDDDDDDDDGDDDYYRNSINTMDKWHDTLSAEYDRPIQGTEHVVSWTLTDILYQRYGFKFHLFYTANAPDPQYTWLTIQKTFGLKPTTPRSDELHQPVSQFLGHFITSPPTQPCSSMWDLGEDCATPFQAVAQDIPFQVHALTDHGICHYILSARGPSSATPWVLEFEDPATVLECLRRQERTIFELTEFLCMHGAPFNTCRPRNQLSSSSQSYRPVTLGWRQPLHKGTRFEYNFYQERRDRLLHCPHGRAALLAGGIVWHLAMDSLVDDSGE